jgi:rhodanese-related sulfurtransferase
MKNYTFSLGAVLIALVLGAPAKDVKPKPYPLKVCIVASNKLGSMGKPVVLVHKGQEVKFCCKGCIGKFTKNPKKYLVNLKGQGSHSVEPARPKADGLKVYGALRAIFHQGQTGTMVTLDKLLPNPNLYAVGALTELSGEVTIVGGKTYLSYPKGNKELTVAPSKTRAGATLLVTASVREWRSVTTKKAIAFKDIDEAIGKLAVAMGLNLDGRFPFLLEGDFTDLQWHVIDGTRLKQNSTSHKDHLAAAVQLKHKRASAVLIGFYSKTDQGVFTHMGSRTHIHCVIKKPLSTGHVDHVIIPAGTTVKFPVANKPAAPPKKRVEHTKDSLDVVKARLAKGTAVLIDVREPFEWNDGHLKAATLVPLSDIREAKSDAAAAKKLAKKLPAKKIIYLHCRSGGRVMAAAPILRAMNFDVRPLKAGYSTLVKEGFEKAK